MTRHVALLRGINVGAHHRIPMPRLREVLAAAGLSDVRTYVQSGNVVFEAGERSPEESAALLVREIEAAFSLNVPVVVRTGEELADVVAANPLADVATDP